MEARQCPCPGRNADIEGKDGRRDVSRTAQEIRRVKKRFEEKFGISFEDQYGSVVSELTEQGLLVPDRDIVRMTKQGLF